MFRCDYLFFLKHNFKARFFNQQKPLLAGYKITHRCNLKCRTCPFWKMSTPDPTYDQIITNLEKIWKDGVRLLIFEGGEPFLWHDQNYQLEDLVRAAKQKFFSVGITTNGTFPLETTADTVWISLDGLPATHQLNRKVSFEKIIANIAASRHPNLLANITISRLNYQDIPALIRYLKNIVKGITIQFYYPFPNSEDLWLPHQQRIEVLEQLISLKKAGYPLLDTISTLQALKHNTWRCHPWLISSLEPDGSIAYGCYLKNRADIACEKCGFAAHVELSKAYDWHFPAIISGHRIFKFRLL